jgi:hypothetical protein
MLVSILDGDWTRGLESTCSLCIKELAVLSIINWRSSRIRTHGCGRTMSLVNCTTCEYRP